MVLGQNGLFHLILYKKNLNWAYYIVWFDLRSILLTLSYQNIHNKFWLQKYIDLRWKENQRYNQTDIFFYSHRCPGASKYILIIVEIWACWSKKQWRSSVENWWNKFEFLEIFIIFFFWCEYMPKTKQRNHTRLDNGVLRVQQHQTTAKHWNQLARW